MKLYIAGLLAGCFLCGIIVAQVTNSPPDSESRPMPGPDQNLRDKLVGVWSLSVTNPPRRGDSGQWMSTETEYHRDGTFELKGKLGTIIPPEMANKTFVDQNGKEGHLESSTRSADGSGIWRIDQGLLYSTFTHGNWQTNETRWEIVSLTDTDFTYRLEDEHAKGQVLKAIRKR